MTGAAMLGAMTQPSPPATDAVPPGLGWLAQMAEAIEELCWVCDAGGGRVLYANTAFRRFWGPVAPADHGKDLLLVHVVPDDRERLRRARAGLGAGIDGYSEEYRASQPSGGSRPGRIARLRERAFTLRDIAGRPLAVHVATDISWQFDTTAQLRAEISRRSDAERELDDTTRRLEALVATSNDALITIDADSVIIDWNAAAHRMFGWDRPEALGRKLTELIMPPAHHAQHLAGITRFLQEGTSRIFDRRVEATALRRTGELFDAELSVWPVKSGERTTFSAFVRDISRRKTAERALAESEAKYRTVVENVNEGILVTAAGRILYANPRALALTGMQDEETAKSRPFIEFIHPEDRDRVLDNHLRRLRGEPVENYYQFRVVHRSQEVRWLEISAVLFEWQNNPATLNFLTDVTQRRQAEQEIRAALVRERELSELKSRFVAVASHEFRTPLAAILSSVELLGDYGARLPDSERQEIVGLIKTAVARMNGMVEQVLLTSRLESGAFFFEPMPCVLPQLLVQVATELDQANPQAARIAMRCEGVDEARQLDARLVRHILVNLLGNALKYSPPESPVSCSVRAEGEQLHLLVTDQGIGIPPADLPRLFESFHRGTNVGNIQGTGIGLHIVKECVELHRGGIEVRGEPGGGTTFHVRLHAPALSATTDRLEA